MNIWLIWLGFPMSSYKNTRWSPFYFIFLRIQRLLPSKDGNPNNKRLSVWWLTSWVNNPGSPPKTQHFWWVGGNELPFVLVWVYRSSKGTTIFKMVVDFQGKFWVISTAMETLTGCVSPQKSSGCYHSRGGKKAPLGCLGYIGGWQTT